MRKLYKLPKFLRQEALNRYVQRKSDKTVSFSFLPILAYSLPTYVLTYPSFFVNNLSNYMPYWEVFLIISLPYLSRIIGGFLYTHIKSFSIPFIILGILTILQDEISLLFIVRVLIGIIFGLTITYALDKASKSNLMTGITTAGRSIGWLLSYISYSLIHNWNEINIVSGIIITATSLLGIKELRIRHRDRDKGKEESSRKKRNPTSLTTVLLYFSAMTPGFLLQVIPSLLEKEGLVDLLLPSYVLSIFAYLLLPLVGASIGYKLTTVLISVSTLITGVLTFTIFPYTVSIFAPLSLSLTAVIPRYLVSKGEKAENLGVAQNMGSASGMVIPVLFAFNPETPEYFLSICSLIAILI
ncbi:transporter [Sulfolobus acidocaldarius SUSAZ]|nr:transporter [Sulfolobus acidocaldarius SUSAZ]